PVMEGFEVTRVSSGPNGDYITQKPERGETFRVPEGHVVKGVSALVDGDGRTVQQWVKTTNGPDDTTLADAVRAAFDDYVPRVAKRPVTRDDVVTVIPLPDLHVGLLAWEEETGGNYDMHIARETMRRALIDLVES